MRASTDQGRQGLLLEVSDQGPGVPPDQRERVFEPFVSGKATGMGLGLAISRAIADAEAAELAQSNEGAATE